MRVNKRSFSIVELLVVVFILGLLITALFLSLTTSEFSHSVTSAKADLQAKIRYVIDWIVKDVRQANLTEINNNNPSGSHVKFRKVMGIDNSTGNYVLSTNYIEYSFDAASEQLLRREVDPAGNILQSWTFSNITKLPFYTAPGVALTEGAILNSGKLIVLIEGQNQFKGSSTITFSLTEEVRIRNE